MSSYGKNIFAFAALFFLVFLVYSNTFHSSWQLDDFHSIVENPHIHISNLRPQSLIQTFFAAFDDGLYLGKRIYRPIPCLTLGLNWYSGKDNVVGYHIVNILIHFLTAFILYLTVLNLLKTPNLNDRYQGSEYFIAILTAALWALNPIQTQAVTYIAQRMTSLSGMFCVLSIYFFVKGRTVNVRSKNILLLFVCLLCFLFATASKENAVVLPAALLLVEVIFFQNLSIPGTKKKVFWAITGIGLFILISGTLVLILRKGDPIAFIYELYDKRPFTLFERMMTEPGILLFYLTLIFYPAPGRLSIEHSVTISKSLFEPWTTIPAILIILFIIGIGLFQIRKRPLIALAILFFFINHLVESTIIPLELIFEHRNYVPSFFLFLPVAAGIKWLLDYFRQNSRSLYLVFSAFILLFVAGFGTGTYIRNMAWATEKSLLEDAITKAPNNSRPYNNLARGYFTKTGDFDKAMELFKKALFLVDPKRKDEKSVIYCNIGHAFYDKNEFKKAIIYFKKSMDTYPQYKQAHYNMILTLVKIGRWNEALKNADLLLLKRHNHKDYQGIKGLILLRQQKPRKALLYLASALRLSPNDKQTILRTGVALSRIGKYRLAESCFKRIILSCPNEIIGFFCLIENRLRAGDRQGAQRYVQGLFASFSIEDIRTALKEIPEDNLLVPVSRELLAPVIEKKANEIDLNL